MVECKRSWVVALIVLLVSTAVFVWLIFHLQGSRKSRPTNWLGTFDSASQLGKYSRFAISTDAAPCAKVGKDILEKENATAIDSVVAVLLCMGVIIPESMGIGGGGIMTIYDSRTGKGQIINFREWAPHYATEDMFKGQASLSQQGPLAVAVPGELAGYWEAHRRYGKLPWRDLFEGAIHYAENGFVVHQHLEDSARSKKAQIMNSNLRDVYINPKTNDVYKVGEILRQPGLARTLKKLAQSNPLEEFYGGGELGRNFIQDLQALGGNMTHDDLLNYRVSVVDPVEAQLRGNLTAYGPPPPGSGILLNFIMQVMGKYRDLYPDEASASLESASLFWHRMTETFKFTFAKRMYFEDMRHAAQEPREAMANMTDPNFIQAIWQSINDNRTFAGVTHYGLDLPVGASNHGTSHVSIVDSSGISVAVSSTVNAYFGAKIMSPSTGLIYNNQMDDFASPNITNDFKVPPSPYNRIVPGKRPFSSMCPTIIVDNATKKVRLAIGGSGGTKITTATAMVAMRNLWLGENIKAAIDAPRPHHQLIPNWITYEYNFPQNLVDELAKRGHNMTAQPMSERGAIIMAIARDMKTGDLFANSDWRKGGAVDGAN